MDVTVPVTGVSGFGSVGPSIPLQLEAGGFLLLETGFAVALEQTASIDADAGSIAAVTGVATTGAVGQVVVEADAVVSPDGVEATGAVGQVVVDVLTVAAVTSAATTGAVGQVDVEADAAFVTTGVETAGAVGQVVGLPSIEVDVTGVEAVLNEVFHIQLETGDFLLLEDGSKVQIEPASVLALAGAEFVAIGVEATGEVGQVVGLPSIEVDVVGVEAVAEVGAAEGQAGAIFAIFGSSATAFVGVALGEAGAGADVTGVETEIQVGDVQITGNADAFPVGVSATGVVNAVIVWSRVIPDQDALWLPIGRAFLLLENGGFVLKEDGEVLLQEVSTTETDWDTITPGAGSVWVPVAA